MRAQIRGLDMASKNAMDGISLVQTAEGGMQEIDSMIQRIRELVVQASNDTNEGPEYDRRKLQDEIDQLTQGIDQMAGMVEFNKKRLLDGSYMDITTKNSALTTVGAKLAAALGAAVATNATAISLGTAVGSLAPLLNNGGANISMTFATFSANANQLTTLSSSQGTVGSISVTAATSGGTVAIAATDLLGGTDLLNMSAFIGSSFATSMLNDDAAFNAYIGKMDEYINKLKDASAAFGGMDANFKATLDLAVTNAQTKLGNLKDLKTGWGVAQADFMSFQAYASAPAGESIYLQIGANANQGISFGIGSIKTGILGIGNSNGVSSIKVTQASGATITSQIATVENALQYVVSERSKLGAIQNRLEYTRTSLDISSENLSAAESRIRDADMAKEMMRLTASNILQQAGVSMLAQANQNPQSVLQLLR